MDIKQQLNEQEVLLGLCILSVYEVRDHAVDVNYYTVVATESYGDESGKLYLFADIGDGLVYVGASGDDLIDEPYWNRVV